MDPKIKELRKKAMQLPLTPGVYLMKNSSSEIIYVGKAKALKNRVSQYFGSEHNHTVKVRKMVENVDDFDVILTDSEFEALVLECSLIKQHSPKYNILLKDDKGYSYIKVTPGKWRNIYAVLQREDDGAKYIGPYMSSFAARNTVDEAKKYSACRSAAKCSRATSGRAARASISLSASAAACAAARCRSRSITKRSRTLSRL